MNQESAGAPRWISLDPNADRAPRAWPKFMTARVAADYCDTSKWTIRRHVTPCGRRGRVLVYSLESIEQWMRGQVISKSMNRNSEITLPRPSTGASVVSISRIRKIAKHRHCDEATRLVHGDGDVAA